MARLFIVDDERDVVTLLKFLLEKDGHEVQTAYDGEEALAKLGVEPPAQDGAAPVPDLIIMDVMMPVLDGYAVSSKLASCARTRGVPLIVLTGKGEMRELFDRAKNVAAYIEKPFDPHKLRELISGMLEGKR